MLKFPLTGKIANGFRQRAGESPRLLRQTVIVDLRVVKKRKETEKTQFGKTEDNVQATDESGSEKTHCRNVTHS